MSKPKKKKIDETKPENEATQDEEGNFAQFVTSAMRAPRQGIYEHLLSQFMAQAVLVTDPLKRIKLVCEAALMVPERDRENLAIDYEKIEVLYAIANSLLNQAVRSDQLARDAVVSIPWGFIPNEENFKKYVAPWYNVHLIEYWAPLLKHCVKLRYDSYGFPHVVSISEEPAWFFFYDVSICLTITAYNRLKNAFAAWAIPTVQAYLAELTQIVSPSLYAEILGLTTRGKKASYAEKVKEATPPPEATVEG